MMSLSFASGFYVWLSPPVASLRYLIVHSPGLSLADVKAVRFGTRTQFSPYVNFLNNRPRRVFLRESSGRPFLGNLRRLNFIFLDLLI